MEWKGYLVCFDLFAHNTTRFLTHNFERIYDVIVFYALRCDNLCRQNAFKEELKGMLCLA